MKIQTLLASLLVSGAAMAQTPTMKPIVMKTPNEFYILAASGNGKWACGTYSDYSNEQYGFLWNLETGEIELDFISQIITNNTTAIKAIAIKVPSLS